MENPKYSLHLFAGIGGGMLADIIGGDTAHAVEECYDTIAVLLRIIDVLEGRQRLGKPETKGEMK